MTLSIVIVNWNSKDYIRKCLQAIDRTCPGHRFQIIVVDGASFDGCGEMLAEEFPAVEFVQCEENIGFGRCNNLGFENVTGDAVLFLNPDTEVHDGAISTLLAHLSRQQHAGVLGARLLNSDGTLQTSCVLAFPTPSNQALDSELLRRLLPQSTLWDVSKAFSADEMVKVQAVSGACMMMRSIVFRKVLGFSAELFMYEEDIDLCWEAEKLGLSNYYVPTAIITHHGGGSSSGTASNFSTIWMRQSVSQFIRKRQGKGAACAYRFAMGLSSVIRLAILLPSLGLTRNTRRERCRQSISKWFAILRWCCGLERMTAS